MNTAQSVSTEHLAYWIEQGQKFTLIDVLPREFYEEEHLPGARQACVYEVTFLSQVYAIQPDRQKDIVVYASSRRSHAAAVAAERLVNAGYTNVYEYEGGTEEWRSAGHALEGTKASAPRPQLAPETEPRTFFVDTRKSRLEWIGRNITGAHTGTLTIAEGFIQAVGDEAMHAAFTIDMESIANSDIRDDKLNKLLISHLKSEDFFHVSKHPRAIFEVTALEFVPNAPAGSVNCSVRGSLTMRGLTNEIAFPAIIEKSADGSIVAEAHFDIDRTRWNIIYGSGKFFEKLGKHLVYDDISIHLKLVAR
jgi:polyisoprenoid-binding protein YceI